MGIFRVLKFSIALRIIISKIFSSVKTLFWVMILICMLLFAIGVCLTHGATAYLDDQEHGEVESYYGSLWRSILTLFESVTGGVPWGGAAEALLDIHWFYGGLFFAYIAL